MTNTPSPIEHLHLELAHMHRECKMLVESIDALKHQLQWHSRFDADAVRARHSASVAQRAEMLTKKSVLEAKRAPIDLQIAAVAPHAELGFNPARWFSSERAVAKRKLTSLTEEMSRTNATIVKLGLEIDHVVEEAAFATAELLRYQEMDVAVVQGLLADKEHDLKEKESAVSDRQRRIDAIERRIRGPLEDYQAAFASASGIKGDLATAESMESALSAALNGYEKSQIHERCQSLFGNSSPRFVVNKLLNKLNKAERDLEKLKAKLDREVRFAMIDVRAVVIDGNNLCYEGQGKQRTCIGTSALVKLVPLLSQRYEVKLVFDRGVRSMLGKSVEDIQALFPDAKTYVMNSKAQADQLVLASADEPGAYVISGDYYRDYQHMACVRQNRLLQPEIAHGVAIIEVLGVVLNYQSELEPD